MPITEEQRQQRRKFIGGSDIAALLGYSPFGNPISVWESKVKELDKKETTALKIGNLLEPIVLKLAEEDLQSPVLEHPTITHGNMAVNIDGYCGAGWLYRQKPQAEECLLEAKTAGFAGPPMEDWSGRAGTDQVPPRIALQCMYQLHVVRAAGIFPKAKICWVPIVTGHDGKGYRKFRIQYSPALGNRLEAIATHFWKKWVETNVEPPAIINWNMELS